MRLTPGITDGITDGALDQVNLPGVVLLATSGVLGMIFVIRLMVKFQREFTNFYVIENTKLRDRIDTLESELIAKQAEITILTREQLRYEAESQRQIAQLENIISRHENTIERHERIIERRRDMGPGNDDN